MTRTSFLTLCSTLLIVQVFLARPCPAVDTILYRYSNPESASSAGECRLELYIAGTRATGKLIDTRMGQGGKPWNTNITFNGTLTGRWEAGRWLGEGDRRNGRVVGTWNGQAAPNDRNVDRLQTYATGGRIEIFMGSRTNLRVLMGAKLLEYDFRLEGRTATVFSPIDDASPLKPQTQISGVTQQLSPSVGPTRGGTVKGIEEALNGEWGGNLNKDLVFYNGNKEGVGNNGRNPTFTLQEPRHIHFIMNYHYNGGRGAAPGTISFRDARGRTFGPWRAAGAHGNRYWIVQPAIVLPVGTYTIVDSDPATWSCNAGSGMNGHSLVKGTYLAR